MTRAQLTAFREASARIDDHRKRRAANLAGSSMCRCPQCDTDRETIIDNAPAVVKWIDGVVGATRTGGDFWGGS